MSRLPQLAKEERLVGAANYCTWAGAVKDLLVVSSCIDWLDVKPADYGKWLTDDKKNSDQDRLAKAVLALNAAPEPAEVIRQCQNARGAWKRLRQLYCPDNPIARTNQLRALLALKQHQRETVERWLHRSETEFQRWIASGAPEKESTVQEIRRMVTVHGLRDEFASWRDARDAAGTTFTMSLDDLRSSLQAEEARLTAQTAPVKAVAYGATGSGTQDAEDESNQPHAPQANRTHNYGSPRRYRGGRGGRGNRGGRGGRGGRGRGRFPGRYTAGTLAQQQCATCGGRGHLPSQCPNPQNAAAYALAAQEEPIAGTPTPPC